MNVRWGGAGKQLTCLKIAEQEPPPGAKLAAHCRSPRTPVIFKLIIAAIGGIKAMRGGKESQMSGSVRKAHGAASDCVRGRVSKIHEALSDFIQG